MIRLVRERLLMRMGVCHKQWRGLRILLLFICFQCPMIWLVQIDSTWQLLFSANVLVFVGLEIICDFCLGSPCYLSIWRQINLCSPSVARFYFRCGMQQSAKSVKRLDGVINTRQIPATCQSSLRWNNSLISHAISLFWLTRECSKWRE